MTVLLVLVFGPGLGEPLTSLHTTTAGARAALVDHARALLADRLGYVPSRVQVPLLPALGDLVDELAGIGLTAIVDELSVAA